MLQRIAANEDLKVGPHPLRDDRGAVLLEDNLLQPQNSGAGRKRHPCRLARDASHRERERPPCAVRS